MRIFARLRRITRHGPATHSVVGTRQEERELMPVETDRAVVAGSRDASRAFRSRTANHAGDGLLRATYCDLLFLNFRSVTTAMRQIRRNIPPDNSRCIQPGASYANVPMAHTTSMTIAASSPMSMS